MLIVQLCAQAVWEEIFLLSPHCLDKRSLNPSTSHWRPHDRVLLWLQPERTISPPLHTWTLIWWGSHDQKEMSYSKKVHASPRMNITSFPYSLLVRWWSHWLYFDEETTIVSYMCTHSKTVEDREQLPKYVNNVSKLLHTVCEQICYHLERSQIW